MKYPIITVTILMILACFCTSAEEQPVQVENALQATSWILVPFDSIGIEGGDTTLMFGSIWGADYTANGNIAVLDKAIGGIRFFTAEGAYIESFIPYGEGPGEFMSLDRMGFDHAGNLYLASFYDRKMCLYDSDFNLIREVLITTGERTGPFKMYPGPDSSFIALTWVFQGDSVGTELSRFSTTDIPDVIYRCRMMSADGSMDYQSETGMAAAVNPDGRVYVADYVFDQFKLICYSPSGDSLLSFGFDDYEAHPIPEEIRDQTRARALDSYIQRYGDAEGFNYEPAEFYKPISSIAIDSLNRVWVREEFNTRIAYIFSEDGSYLFNMEADLPDWQDTKGFNFRISPRGILVDPRNPEMYPLIYLMKEEEQAANE